MTGPPACPEIGVERDRSISDLLSDLRDLCDALGEDVDTESARGEPQYAAEIRGAFR